MADICVILDSNDESIVSKLVDLLRLKWDVWWYLDNAQGPWEPETRKQIERAKVVVAVISSSSITNDTFTDELRLSKEKGILIYPFIIDGSTQTDMPLGFGGIVFTIAKDWNGSNSHPGYKELIKKIASELAPRENNPSYKELVKWINSGSTRTKRNEGVISRAKSIEIGNKKIKLPSFVFSLSSHETQLHPKDGIELFHFIEPACALISSYDVKKKTSNSILYKNEIKELIQSPSVVYFDSGNYEASRKKDYKSKNNPNGWGRKKYFEVINKLSPDIAFSYDHPNPKGTERNTIQAIVKNYLSDKRAIKSTTTFLVPIVHLPDHVIGSLSVCASNILSKVVEKIDPIMIAIPERELGDGLIKRFIAVREIRKSLNKLGKYYPLHLLGTGNPLTISALAAAGADSFDGLEWCRTSADPESGHLFHFHQFDCFSKARTIQLGKLRTFIENPAIPYRLRVVSYNFDYFVEWITYIQDMVHSGQESHLLKNIPHIGSKLLEEMKK